VHAPQMQRLPSPTDAPTDALSDVPTDATQTPVRPIRATQRHNYAHFSTHGYDGTASKSSNREMDSDYCETSSDDMESGLQLSSDNEISDDEGLLLDEEAASDSDASIAHLRSPLRQPHAMKLTATITDIGEHAGSHRTELRASRRQARVAASLQFTAAEYNVSFGMIFVQ
jgi:hypothetical protein